MKIIHVGLGGSSGSAAASRRLDALLKEYEIQSDWIELFFSKGESYKGIISNFFQIVKNRLVYGRVRVKNTSAFYTSEVSLVSKQLEKLNDADIIHIHWVAGFFSFNDIKRIIELRKPIVWTCHDSWIFTGGCCVKEGCEEYQRGCQQCKYIKGKREKDISYWHYSQKKKMVCDAGITFIAPSIWMKNTLENSYLKKERILHIGNIPNYKVFLQRTRTEILNRFTQINLDDSKVNLLFGADSLAFTYKGTKDIIDVLQLLYKTDRKMVNNIRIFILGSNWVENDIINQFEHYYLGHIDNEYDMSCAYSMADILLFPSHDDNLPYMVIESIACGTPVLSYAIGGIPEIIEHKKSGYLVAEVSVQKYCEGLKWLIDNPLERSDVSQCVREKFNECQITEAHIRLYNSLL